MKDFWLQTFRVLWSKPRCIDDSISKTENAAMLLTFLHQTGKDWRFPKNVKYIAVSSRASKLQVFKVGPGRDLSLGLPRESLNMGLLTHAGDPGSNPSQAELWRLVTLKSLKLQQCSLHFWKPLIFFYLGKRGQERSCMFSLWYAIENTHRFAS